ncbi:hypothetical protein [Hyphomicrobium sp.]|uniref:hypothetical protein n=1 Tax=Hyphomicrobium sp. TaxID=82 RepID=UPI0025BC220B|nr:hypothetical protein [Hyphomicrobium sp.]
MISGTTAGPAAGESSSAAGTESWLTHVSPSEADEEGWVAQVSPAENKADGRYADPQYVGAYSDVDKKGELPQVTGRTTWLDPGEGQADAQKKPAGKTAKAPANGETADKAEKAASGTSVAGLFRPDPQYDASYDAQGNVDVYGAKSAVEPPRPLLEIGRQQYTSGMYDESSTFLGEKNPLLPGLAIYGDWRTAVAYNNNNGKDIAQIATRLNLDVDFKITGTERIHAFFTPIQDGAAKFTRYEFGGGGANDRFNDEYDFEPQTLFFEGDVGSIYSGFSGNETSFDLPFTVGLFPLFLQNGIWANDAILGGAVSLPAKNSAALGLANFDVTFFAAFDNVDNVGIIGADSHVANLYGVTAFIDAFDGYIETGYALVDGYDDRDGLMVHFLTAAYSRRYYNTVSNSTRVFANFGDDPDGDSDGIAIISENSLITGLPSTLLPYANFFVGFGNPQPLVDGNGAGILKNVGINFETDALTGYPKLDDTGSDAFGGAIGLQYLFDLDQQLVFEVAMVQPFDDDGIGAQDPQYGFGVRYQIPIDRAWLFRADATYHIIEGAEEDNFGIRTELRRKF